MNDYQQHLCPAYSEKSGRFRSFSPVDLISLLLSAIERLALDLHFSMQILG